MRRQEIAGLVVASSAVLFVAALRARNPSWSTASAAALLAASATVGIDETQGRAAGSARQISRLLVYAGLLGACASAAAALGDYAARVLSQYTSDIPIVGAAIAVLCRVLGQPVTQTSGALNVSGLSGPLRIAVTPELCGMSTVLAMGAAACLVGYIVGSSKRSMAWYMAAAVTGAVIRGAFAVLLTADAAQPFGRLTEMLPAAWYSLPWTALLCGAAILIAMVGAGDATIADVRANRRTHVSVHVLWNRWPAITAAALSSCTVVVAVLIDLPGTRHPGRVVLDDSLSGWWAPAARRPSFDWFGDFATYGFGGAAEFLGHYYDVSVNADMPYSRELLSKCDVLILKVPQRRLADAERLAIIDYVRHGGGLLLVGDHTNLLGSSDSLNALSQVAGITFNPDAVLDASTGGFSYYRAGSPLTEHPALGGVPAIEFMTSCSLSLQWPARPLIMVDNQYGQKFDYGNSSNFGTAGSDPEVRTGTLCLAATGSIGEGRVVAWADSTGLSTFGVFTWNRADALLSVIGYLNTSTSRDHAVWLVILLISGAVLGWCAWRHTTSPSVVRLILCASALLIGVPLGCAACWCAELALYPGAQPITKPYRMGIAVTAMEGAIPPVLGASVSGEDLRWSYDTLIAALPRAGIFPKLLGESMDATECSSILVLNPFRAPTADEVVSCRQLLQRGGVVVVATHVDHFHQAAFEAWLGISDRPWTEGRSLSHQAGSYVAQKLKAGEGAIITVLGTEDWSREALGHAMAWPTRENKDSYDGLSEFCAFLVPDHQHRAADYRVLRGDTEP